MCVCLYMHLRCVSVPLSVRLCVFLCLALLCVCESHPLTAAELSLIQLCLLSCLPVASAPPAQLWLGLGLPLPASLQPPVFASGPVSGSQSLPLRCFLSLSVMVTTSTCLSLLVPFLSPPLFFSCLSYLFIQQTSSPASHPLYQPLCWCLGPGDGSHLRHALKA